MAIDARPATRPRTGRRAETAGPRFRTDIQALRALAVGLVVVNHLWPLQLSGGYVGVDVFFVISGFLISSHLLRELQATGRVALARFYARRARRLFPAAFLVLGSSMLLAVLFLPYPRWINTAQEVLASVFYFENWLLAARSVDYSAQTEAASAVQHYWSLSVEEQFYLFWPLTLLLLAAIAFRLGRPARRVLFAGVAGIALLSFACSLYVTATAPTQAYFATPARIWEFAAGALMALGAVQLRSRRLRNILAVAGFGLILAAALAYDQQTPFPGWTALVPVLGTAMVITAGTGGPLAHDRVTGLAPVQFVGRISYSLYLWHWPLIVVAPFLFGTAPAAPHKLLLLAAAILLAWATKRWVEDRWIGRRGRRALRSRSRDFGRPVAGMAAVAVAAGLLVGAGSIKQSQAVELAAAGATGPCYGPSALADEGCGDPFAIAVPLPHMGKDNAYWHAPKECPEVSDLLLEGGPPASCDFSGGDPNAEVVWLAGDSHAQQWLDPLVELAKERNWHLKWSFLGGCPLLDAPVSVFEGVDVSGAAVAHCQRWSRTVTDAVEEERPDKVFVSMFAAREIIDDGTGRPQQEQYADALARDWKRWIAAGITVLPIHDPPLNGAVRDPECLAMNAGAPLECAADRDLAVPFDPFPAAVEQVGGDRIRPVDLTDAFCDEDRCYAAVGGVSVYFDANHLNADYSRKLVPLLAAKMD